MKKDGIAGTGVFDMDGNGVVVMNMDNHEMAPKVPPTKTQLKAAEKSIAKENIPGRSLWIPWLEAIQSRT